MSKDRCKFVAILSLAVVLRLINLGRIELWYDEGFTDWVTSVTLPQMLQALAGDVHPPLYYLIIWVIRPLVDGPHGELSRWLIRMPSVIMGVAAVYLVYRIARSGIWRTQVVWGVTIYMAICQFQIFYSQEARMYALLQLAVLFGYLMVLQRRWLWVGAAVVVMAYTHNYGLFYAAALSLVAVWNTFKRWPVLVDSAATRRLRRAGIFNDLLHISPAFLVPAVLWLPWGWVMFRQMQTVAGGYWITPVSPGTAIVSVFYVLFGISQYTALYALSVIVVLGAIMLTVVRLAQRPAAKFVPPALMATVPLALSLILSVAWRPIFLYRALIASAPFLVILVLEVLLDTWPIQRLDRYKPAITAALLLPLMAASLVHYYTQPPKSDGKFAAIYQVLADRWQEGDIIYHVDAGSFPIWMVYSPDWPQYMAPAVGDSTLGSLSAQTLDAMGVQQAPLSDVMHTRAWVIWGLGPTSRSSMLYYDYLADPDKLAVTIQHTKFVDSGIYLHAKSEGLVTP